MNLHHIGSTSEEYRDSNRRNRWEELGKSEFYTLDGIRWKIANQQRECAVELPDSHRRKTRRRVLIHSIISSPKLMRRSPMKVVRSELVRNTEKVLSMYMKMPDGDEESPKEW
jgi:hypothetical protein